MKKIGSTFRSTVVFGCIVLADTQVSAASISPPIMAQVPSQVKTGFQYGLGLLFMIGFIWGVINIWGGADRLKKGDADGKMGIVSGIIIAGAAAIMAAMFYIFGMSDGALTPQF
ncbi:hypothetical protein OH491_19160 [Termitidicoccus mucosus]|uniref:hypothetical protein n=1 Tax=Termitidicoccus mucosus TaxID=1184151 RepID=UPI000A06F274